MVSTHIRSWVKIVEGSGGTPKYQLRSFDRTSLEHDLQVVLITPGHQKANLILMMIKMKYVLMVMESEIYVFSKLIVQKNKSETSAALVILLQVEFVLNAEF